MVFIALFCATILRTLILMHPMFSVGKSYTSFFSWYIKSVFVIPRFLLHNHQLSRPLIHLSKFLPSQFQKWWKAFYKGPYPGVYPFDKISAAKLGFAKHSPFSKVFFFSVSSLGWMYPLPIFPCSCNFQTSQAFNQFYNLVIQFLFLFLFFANTFKASMYITWLILSSDFVNL